MANYDAAIGFQILGRNWNGGEPNAKLFPKGALAVYPGDQIARDNGGDLTRTITPATTLLSGIVAAYSPTTQLWAMVYTPSDAVFMVQSDATLAAADMGLNAPGVINSGSTTLLQSRDELDGSDTGTENTKDFHVHDKVNFPGNDWGADVKVIVTFNKHRMADNTVGI